MNIKKILLLLFAELILAGNNYGQFWYLTRGLSTEEVAWGVDADSAGNIYWAVEEKDQWPYWYFNIFLFRIDSAGQEIWQSSPYGWTYNDIAFVVKVEGENVYLAGRSDSTASPVSGDVRVLNYNIDDGALNWDYLHNPVPDYGYEEIDGISIQPDGIYLTGWTKGQTTDEDFLVQKISLTGSLIWTNSWDYNSQFDGANGHMAMDDSFIYAAGHTSLLKGSLVCFSRSDGTYRWDVTWSGSGNDEVLGLTMSADSMLYTVGYYLQGSSQTCVKKFARNGQLKWTRNWGGAGTEDSRALVADGDSITYVVGTTSSYGSGGKDIFILKYDSAGTLMDSLIWGGTYDEVAKDVVMYGDYLYITGETQSFGNGKINGDYKEDGLLLKVNGRTMQAPDSTMANINGSQTVHSKWQVYPNPSRGEFAIQHSGPEVRNAEVRIFDMLGQEVFRSAFRNRYSALHLNLPDGIYFLQIVSCDFITTKKLEVIK